jgi:thioesterase domain-containing protein
LIEKMRSVQPEGPYNIAGLCVNGVIAYEMAKQLQEAGQEIGVLALFDAQNPEYYHTFTGEDRTQAVWNKIDFHINKLLAATPASLPSLFQERVKRLGQRLNILRWRVYHQLALRVDEQHLRNLDVVIHPASYDYRPKSLNGKVLFFQSSEWPSGNYWNFYESWKDMIADLKIIRVKGGHETMFAEENVSPIIEGLSEGLNQVNSVALVSH